MAAMTDVENYFITFLLVLTSTFILQYILRRLTKHSTHLCLPPSPPALPLIGHLHYLSPAAYKCLHNLCSKYGPLLYLRLGSFPVLLVSSASMANEIFKTHDLNFAYKPKSPFEDSILFGTSSFFSCPVWRLLEIHEETLSNRIAWSATTRKDLFFGGSSTTAHSMQWLMAEMINHPEVFKKLREEMDSVVGRDRLVEDSDIPIVNAHSVMRDPEVWDKPDEFYPERFLLAIPKEEADEKTGRKGQDLNFWSFGGGRRRCPGVNLAFSLINATVAAMVQCFDWKLDGAEYMARVNMEATPGVTMSLAHPLLCLPVVHCNPFDTPAKDNQATD
ncbi:hypothetical protein D5086_018015 [Populus alba]|uniref:Uncharacterized protein n=1 Tax=Populus alba TaxID=43335 RepID=A0ACC4BP78_POPAL